MAETDPTLHGPPMPAPDPAPAPTPTLAPAPGPSPVRLRIGDADVAVDAAAATAIQAELVRMQTVQAQLANAQRQLTQMNAWRQGVERVFAPPQGPTTEDIDLEFYRSPRAALERVRQNLKAELVQEYGPILQNARQQTQEQFWGGFYRSHEDLAADDDIVRQMATLPQYRTIDTTDAKAMDDFADAVRTRLLGIASRFGGGRGDVAPGPRRVVEPGGGPRPRRAEAASSTQPQPPRTISQMIQARRKQG